MTTTLTVRDVMFRKPPPLYERPAELSFVRVGQPDRQMPDPYGASTPGTLFRSWRDASLPGVALAAASSARLRDVRTVDRADSVVVRTISPDPFAVLGVGAVEGRTFTEATARVGGFREAVLSRRLWHALFDDRPGAIGSTIWIENQPFAQVRRKSCGASFAMASAAAARTTSHSTFAVMPFPQTRPTLPMARNTVPSRR